MKLDIQPPQLAEVREILKNRAPALTVWAFGSRVNGRARRFSDLDLALVSDEPLPKDIVWALRESFSDSDLPFRVDVIDLASVSDDFKAVVAGNHIVLQGPPQTP